VSQNPICREIVTINELCRRIWDCSRSTSKMEEMIIGACREVFLRQKHARRSTLESIIRNPPGVRIISFRVEIIKEMLILASKWIVQLEKKIPLSFWYFLEVVQKISGFYKISWWLHEKSTAFEIDGKFIEITKSVVKSH